MKCLNCGKESKYEFCRECKEEKHRCWAIISQNKKKLRNLLDRNILEPETFEKFILYTDNIIREWKIYMWYVKQKHLTLFKVLTWWTMLCSALLSLWCISSLIILHI